MKVAIFETEHFETSYTVIKAFEHAGHDVTVFCYENSYRQFKFLFGKQLANFQWVVKSEKKSKIGFIIKVLRESKRRNISLLFLNTISNNYLFYWLMILFLPRKTKVVLTIHNINSWFKFVPALNIRRWVRFLGRKLLLKKVHHFNVIASPMRPQLEKRLPSTRKVHNVPGSFFNSEFARTSKLQPGEEIRIVIPGSVDGRRRDYQAAFDLITRSDVQQLPLHLILLGTAYGEYGKAILKNAQSLSLQHCQLSFYLENFIDQPEFDRVLNSAHFIFSPSVLQTNIEDGVAELYGTTISSGNVFDAVKHAKPFIVPDKLIVDEYLEHGIIKYRDIDEIVKLLESITTGKLSYNDIATASIKASDNYTLDKVVERNRELFQMPE